MLEDKNPLNYNIKEVVNHQPAASCSSTSKLILPPNHLLGVSTFSCFNHQYVNTSLIPHDFVDYSQVADSCSIYVPIPFKLLYVLVFNWNRVFTKKLEKFNNSASILFRQFFGSLSGFLRQYNLKQTRINTTL